ncbi:MAG: glycerol-3-phosphate dehydrogenase/oxidase [Burkholderiaceae bacterium]
MNPSQQRAARLERLIGTEWDALVVGGGITGAGVCREAARRGWRVALIEQRDFAWGTSSRSSKLVHGGLRYLAHGQFRLTLESVRERQRLMREAPELIVLQSFLMAHGPGRTPGRRAVGAALALYDRMAGRRTHAYHGAEDARWLAPGLTVPGLTGATTFHDAKTDDARLVLRVLNEAERDGGLALNYAHALEPVRQGDRIVGMTVHDVEGAATHVVRARCVINATGVWSDALRAAVGGRAMMRPLRGSHLIIPFWRLPVAQSISLSHPRDGRPVFFFPWEGATLVGTTDLDHREPLAQEASITAPEVDYLLDAVNSVFGGLAVTATDVVATYAGVRPVVDDGSAEPSNAAREHLVVSESGLVTVCGGKLTTFRAMAQEALALAAPLAGKDFVRDLGAVFSPASWLDPRWPGAVRRRLAARYGFDAARAAAQAQPGDLEFVAGTETLWLELRVAAQWESVRHLDDLLLRRTRVGILLPRGALDHAPRIRALCRPALGWSDDDWARELARYSEIVGAHYSLPVQGAAP